MNIITPRWIIGHDSTFPVGYISALDNRNKLNVEFVLFTSGYKVIEL